MPHKKIPNLVLPGQKIAIIEEYIVKKGAYEDKNGVIRSLLYGEVIVDEENKELIVNPIRKVKLLNIGDKVLARLFNIVGLYGFVNIFAIKVKQEFKPLDRLFSGTLHPPKVRSSIIPYKLGDYVFAKIVSTKNRTFHLSIDEDEFGVILSFCPICGRKLVRSEDNKLLCTKCRILEYRKLSPHYDKVI